MQQEGGFLKGLNKEQYNAVVEKNGVILVLAGAGSGKTKVLTLRIAQLVNSGVSPNEILAVTFTNKAAKEMQKRLSVYLGENTVKKMWVGTFHGICTRILRYDLENYKTKDNRHWNNNYVIYDDTDTKTVIKNALKKLNLDEKIYDIKTIRSIISNAKNKMQDAYIFASYAKDYFKQKVSEVYYEYEKQLVLNNALDFDDLLMLAVSLLKETPKIREKYSKRFKHILVDEFQDTNEAQYDFIKMLYPIVDAKKDKTGSLCVVGDVDQSIYSWRGADFKIILNFQSDYENSKLIKLEQNYRSTETILKAANEVIKNNNERYEKNLFSSKGEGEKITSYEAVDDYMESKYIANKIEELNYSKDDIAILYRTNAQSRSIEEALMAYSIPYKIIGGVKFYERKEIKDIVSYLKLIYNHNDSQALKRIINAPKRGIGSTTMEKLNSFSDKNEISIYGALKFLNNIENINTSTKAKLENFHAAIEELTSKQYDYSLSEYIAYILEATGYNQELRKDDTIENQSRLENLQEFINVAKEFEDDKYNIDPQDDMGMLGNFLSQVALVSDVDEIKDEKEKETPSVTLMTLHSAKGLEYPVIFLAGLEDGLFPHTRSIAMGTGNSELEEERRLMYVGITRAKEKLFLTHAKQRKVWGNFQSNPQSRFLDEIPSNLINKEYQNSSLLDKYDNSSYKKSSFSAAVSKIKEKKELKTASSDGSIPKISNFASSLERIKASSTKAKENITSITNYKTVNAKIAQKNRIEKLSYAPDVKSMIKKAKQQAKNQNSAVTKRGLGLFPIGARIFHSVFGIGFIKEINSNSYIINFTKAGEKSIDTATCDLKIF